MSSPSFRRLAAIMFTDIVGYTAMMQENEAVALKRIKRHRQVLEACIERNHGEIVQYYGDGSLSLFPSAIDSVNCALEIQRELRIEPKVPLRIGLHIGDIVREADSIFGDGVNVASRIESMGVPGSVLFSRHIRDKLQNQPAFQIFSLGEFHFKNVTESMEVFALSNPGMSVPDKSKITGKLEAPEPVESIAVLPFENMSSDPEQEFFSDGITEEILNALAQIPQLKVAGRTSSFSFKGKHIDLREVGRQLNVRTVLEGSVRKAGNKVRITAQLINAEDGYHLWSQRYDRQLDDIFAVQDEISIAIADKLKLTLLKDRTTSLASPPTTNLDAYQFYLRGRHFLDQRYAVIEKAIVYFQKAIELDPNYATPHAGLALAYLYESFFNFKDAREYMPKALEAIQKALELDPDLPEGHQMMGIIALYYNWDWERALYHDQRAIDLRPQYYEGYRVIAHLYSALKQPAKSIELAEKAVSLDPLNLNAQISLAELLYRAEKYQEALTIANTLISQHPQLGAAYNRKGLCHLMLEEYESALSAIEQGIHVSGGKGWLAVNYTLVLARSGNSQQAFARLESHRNGPGKHWTRLYEAYLFTLVGDTDKALESIEHAVSTHDPFAIIIRVDPILKRLAHLPRFQDLVAKMDFPG